MPTVSPQNPRPDRPIGFDDEIRALVQATAPRLFAVIEEFATDDGEPDAWVAAWGLAYEDGSAQVASQDGRFRLSLRSPERAAEWISRRPGSTGSLVWTNSLPGTAQPNPR